MKPTVYQRPQQVCTCRTREALVAGGGTLSQGAWLGSGATHVVCQPQAAVRWLSMGKTTQHT